MIPINDRYQFGEEIFSSSMGSLFLGNDVSLKRQVYLYRIDRKSKTSQDEYMRMVAGVSHVAHPNFFHILDMGSTPEVYAVMEKREGTHLSHMIQQEKFNLSFQEAVALVIQVGKAVQDALEERIRGYTITAENLWIYRNQVMVINYWSEGEKEHRGVLGLVHLLYQLLARTIAIPPHYEELELHIRENLNQLTPGEKGAILRIIRRAYNGQDSISSIILELSNLFQGPVSAEIPANRIPTEPPEPASETKKRSLTKPKASIAILFLLVALVGVLGKSYWKTEETVIAEPPPVITEVPTKVVEQPVLEPSEIVPEPSNNIEKTQVVPNLVGLTKEAAEKLALEHGLRYQFFLEVSDKKQGEVFKQDLPVGDKVAKETRITFWVSKGSTP